MKTSLAIVLATIALTFGAMLSFTSGVEAQNWGNLSGKSPAYPPSRSRRHYPRPRAQALIVAIVRLVRCTSRSHASGSAQDLASPRSL